MHDVLLKIGNYLSENLYYYPFVYIKDSAFLDYSKSAQTRDVFYLAVACYVKINNIQDDIYICWNAQDGFTHYDVLANKYYVNNVEVDLTFEESYCQLITGKVPLSLPPESINNLATLLASFKFIGEGL